MLLLIVRGINKPGKEKWWEQFGGHWMCGQKKKLEVLIYTGKLLT